MIRSLLRTASLVCVVAVLAPAARAQSTSEIAAVEQDLRIIADAQRTSEIMKNLAYLSDIIGPRVTGSANLKRANEWTAEVMRSYGLTNVRLEPWEIPVGWERGTASLRIVEPDNGKSLTVAAAGWTPGTKGKVQGEVVIFRASKREELAQYRGKLKNAVILRGEPARVAPVTDLTYGPPPAPPGGRKKSPDKDAAAKFEQMREFRQEVADFLRTEGAAVVLSDSAKPHNLVITTGTWRSGDRANAAEPLPSLFVSHEHYALLYRLATRPDAAKTRVEVEVSNKLVPGPVTVYNTVGEIPGEKADEFVVIGAHLDSWDLGQGTTDNGTGSCVVLEAARLLVRSGVKPKRTIRFVLFTGEEQGLHGSKQYVARHKDEMAKTSAALVHDTGTGKVNSICLQGREALKPILDRELATLKILGFNGTTLDRMGGTDHLSFDQIGVPGFACQQDIDEYRLTHHTPSDTLDKAKEPGLVQGSQVMAVTAWRIANLPDLLPREKSPEAEQPTAKGQAEKTSIKPREVTPRPRSKTAHPPRPRCRPSVAAVG